MLKMQGLGGYQELSGKDDELNPSHDHAAGNW